MANLVALGVNVPTARTVQIFVSIIVATIIWASFRHSATILATVGLIVGTFLAVPYAFVYDMPMVTNAVLLGLIVTRIKRIVP